MIQILTLIRFVFPFLLLIAFFCLYRKEYGFMKWFMWKMAMFQSARNLYAYLVVLMLIFINWCCHVRSGNPILESGDSTPGLHLRALHLRLRIPLLCESPSSSY